MANFQGFGGMGPESGTVGKVPKSSFNSQTSANNAVSKSDLLQGAYTAQGGSVSPSTSGNKTAEQLTPLDVSPISKPFDDVAATPEEQIRKAALSAIWAEVTARFQRARETRRPQELIWLRNMHQWRGEYNEDEQARLAVAKSRSKEASDVFIKITKTKTCSALGQIEEILFAGNTFPIGVEAPPEPEGIAKETFVVPEDFQLDDPYGFAGDGRDIAPGTTGAGLLNGLWAKYKNLLSGKKLEEGESPNPKQFPEIRPADEAAENMENYILSQIDEGRVMGEIRKLAWECAVLGTGVLKGPMTYTNTIHTWKRQPDPNSQDGSEINVYSPIVKDVPRSFFVSIWGFYPDPNATRIENCSYICEKHLFNRNQVADLKRFPNFDHNAIERVLRNRAVRTRDYWENQIKDISVTVTDERYEVIEYWGYLEADYIKNLPGVERDELAKLTHQAQVNVWICNNEVLRVTLNPFVPQRMPYYAVPYEEHEYQIWGVGIPENMRDPQKMMNGHWRMMIDNLRFAGSVILEVNENQLVPGQDLTIYPGKIFRKQGGAPGQSIYSISVNNTAPSHIQALDKARQLADEATGQPSYAQGSAIGQTGVRTAAQTSMLMQAAAGSIKQVIRNFDEYLLQPLGQAYFNWNMQFNKDAKVEGSLVITAKGTQALMQKEVQSQRLLQFLQVVSSNPNLTPFANLDYILKQLALSLDLDPEKAVNDPETAQLFAQVIGQMGQMQGQQPPQGGQGAPNGSSEGGGSQDSSNGLGNGTIGAGTPAQAMDNNSPMNSGAQGNGNPSAGSLEVPS
jgi:hypothetical protein